MWRLYLAVLSFVCRKCCHSSDLVNCLNSFIFVQSLWMSHFLPQNLLLVCTVYCFLWEKKIEWMENSVTNRELLSWTGVPLRARHQANRLPKRTISSGWFDHLAQSIADKEAPFKMFCPPVKTSFCPPAENVTMKLLNQGPTCSYVIWICKVIIFRNNTTFITKYSVKYIVWTTLINSRCTL